MKKEFHMTNVVLMKYFLGIEVEKYAQGIFISQHKYATRILKRFIMYKCNPTDTPIATSIELSKQIEG